MKQLTINDALKDGIELCVYGASILFEYYFAVMALLGLTLVFLKVLFNSPVDLSHMQGTKYIVIVGLSPLFFGFARFLHMHCDEHINWKRIDSNWKQVEQDLKKRPFFKPLFKKKVKP